MTRELDPSDAPFSRPLAVTDVPEDGLATTIVANSREREALAADDGLPALPMLEADLEVTRERGGGLRVVGVLRAVARQTCVVSLEEFEQTIVEPIEVSFAPQRAPRPEPAPPRASRSRRGSPPSPEPKDHKTGPIADLDEDAPDPLVDGRIDLGAIVAEFLALALDPYPRKPGASFADHVEDDAPQEASPFAGLRDAVRKGTGN